jgi:predicted dehydrogenase
VQAEGDNVVPDTAYTEGKGMTFEAGIIGAGGIAGLGILGMHDEEAIGREKIDASHAGGYEQTDTIELVAIADIDADKRSRFGSAWAIPHDKQYADHEAMLANETLDVVSVCTPSYLHDRHVVDAAQSAADPEVIWCEKPIASQISSAKQMVSVCDTMDTELVINHSFRFTKKQQQLKRMIQEQNILGEVHSVATQYRMELMRNSTHVIDTIFHLLEEDAAQVQGYITNENEAVDALDANEPVDDSGGGGFFVTDEDTFVSVDCTIPRADSSMTFQFLGTEGKLYLNNDDGEWRYWELDGENHVERPLDGIEGGWTWESDYKGAFANAANHINDLLNGEDENYSSGREAIASLEVIVALYVSHYTGGSVSLPLERPLENITITSW